MSEEELERLAGGSRHDIYRDGDVVRRAWQGWMPAVHALLRHLEQVGFEGAPRVVGDGRDAEGRAVWTYLEGESPQPDPWSDVAIGELGALIREFHESVATFRPPPDASWQRWWIHDIRPACGFGHGELAPWNILAVQGRPVALVDWEFAGPIDPLLDLAQAAWLNAQLHGDNVARLVGLGDAEARAHQLRLFLDGYALDRDRRLGFFDLIVEVAVRSCAYEAELSGASPDHHEVGGAAWAMAWRAAAAGWLLAHRGLLESAIL